MVKISEYYHHKFNVEFARLPIHSTNLTKLKLIAHAPSTEQSLHGVPLACNLGVATPRFGMVVSMKHY